MAPCNRLLTPKMSKNASFKCLNVNNIKKKCIVMSVMYNEVRGNEEKAKKIYKMLLQLIKVWKTVQRKQETYFDLCPVLLNTFSTLVSCPINEKNQNTLNCIIRDLILVLFHLKTKPKTVHHKVRHWKLLEKLLERNKRNLSTFIKFDGKKLIKRYENNKTVKIHVNSVKRFVTEYENNNCPTVIETVQESISPKSVIDKVQEDQVPSTAKRSLVYEDVVAVEEADSPSMLSPPKRKSPRILSAESEARLAKLNQLIALTKFKVARKSLEKDLAEKKITPVKKLVNYFLRRPQSE